MKTLKFLPLLTLMLLAFASCSDDDSSPVLLDVEAETVTNLFAPQEGGVDPMTGQPIPISGEFTKFDFETGTVTTSDTEWDIAFRATTIIVNGGVSQGSTDEPERTGNAGVYIAENTLDGVIEVDTALFNQDSQASLAIPNSSEMGWYLYGGPPNPANPASNLITALPGRILVFRTRDGRYAKVDILSYYRDNPTSSELLMFTDEMKITEARYYTFNYVYQPNEGVTSFE